MATGSGLFMFLRPGLRPQPVDVAAAVSWGVAATTTALWLVQIECIEPAHQSILYDEDLPRLQPFDWLKKQLFEKPEPEK